MMFLILTMMLTSVMFLFLNHPLSFGLILLIQTILISMITGMMSYNFWFSYILFLVMVGGMLILFIYMTSIASNEKFKFSLNMLTMAILLVITNLLALIIDQSLFNTKMNLYMIMEEMKPLYLTKYLNWPANMIMMMIIIYLLITLVTVVKITNIQYGPLRQKF